MVNYQLNLEYFRNVFPRIFISIIFFVGFLFAGTWDVGGKVSVGDLDGDARLSLVITTEYRLNSTLSWRTDLELKFSQLGNSENFDISIPSNLLWYPFERKKPLYPYIGPGIVYTYTYDNKNLFGLNVVGGIKFLFIRSRSFGIEAKYTIVDIGNWKGSQNFDIGFTGTFEVNF